MTSKLIDISHEAQKMTGWLSNHGTGDTMKVIG